MADYIRVTCQCGKILRAPRDYAGRKGRCSSCGAYMEIKEETAIELTEDPIEQLPEKIAEAFRKKEMKEGKEWFLFLLFFFIVLPGLFGICIYIIGKYGWLTAIMWTVAILIFVLLSIAWIGTAIKAYRNKQKSRDGEEG